MAKVLALIPDLLFGSRVVSALSHAGHEVKLVGGGAETARDSADLLILDLTADAAQRLEEATALINAMPSLAFYSHVELEVREQAQAAGVDLVVPRSRMAREGTELVARMLSAHQ